MIEVLVVDDHQLVRTGTARLLADMEGIRVIGMAESGDEAVDKVRDLKPDVVLMDVHMPGMDGLEATRRCLRVDPELKVIAVTIHDDEPYPSKLMSVGASGYVTKKASLNEVVRAIKKVCVGQKYISTDVAQQLALRPYNPTEASPFTQLSSREMQISLMVINGHRVPDIANALSLSPKTVNSYRYRVFEKLNVRNDVGLTKLAISHGLIAREALAQ